MPLTLILSPYTQVEWNTVFTLIFSLQKLQQYMTQSFRKKNCVPHLLFFCLLIFLSIHLSTCRSHLCLYPFFSLSILTFINPWYKFRQGVSLMFEFFLTSVIHNRTEKKINWNPGCVPGILIKISSFNSISSLKFLLLPFFKSRQTAFLLWPNSNDN